MSTGEESRRRNSRAAPAPLSADIGIVAALPIEVGFLLDRLARTRKYTGAEHTVVEGELEGKVVALLVGGAGRAAARRATEVLLEGHRPRWMISAGFAGALDPALSRDDIVLPNVIVDPEGRELAVDVRVGASSPGESTRLRTGRLITVDSIVATAREKAELHARSGALVVDMESSAVAEVCRERSARFLGVRVVSDDAGTDLPPEAVKLMNRSGGRLVGLALRSIWHRPACVKELLQIHMHAQESADRLARVILALLPRLDG